MQTLDLPEVWRTVPSYPGLSASSLGRVRNDLTGTVYATARDQDGYVIGTHWKQGSKWSYRAARLVCEAFHGGIGQVVRHLDGDNFNNCASNLAWGSHSDNAYDRTRHRTNPEVLKTHCPRGHEYSGNNVKVRRGKRECVTCVQAYNKMYNAYRTYKTNINWSDHG